MPWTMTKEVWNIHPGVLVPKEKNKCEFLLLGESRGYGLRTELYPLEGPGHRGGHTLGPRMHSLHKTAAQLARHRTVPLPTMMDTLHCQPHCLESPRQHTSRRASEGFSREKELKDEKPLRPRVLISSCLGPRLNKKEAKSVAVSIPLCFLAHRDATWFFHPAFLSTRKPADTGGQINLPLQQFIPVVFVRSDKNLARTLPSTWFEWQWLHQECRENSEFVSEAQRKDSTLRMEQTVSNPLRKVEVWGNDCGSLSAID